MANLALDSASLTDSNLHQEMHRMLAVHEIVSNILQNARRHDQAMAARTSSLWCDVALDWLWRELDSVLPLLRLLAPLTETSTGLAFARSIEPQNWERFRYYSQRVRSLHHDDGDSDSFTHLQSCSLAPDTSIMLLVLKPAGFGALLPNVQDIDWLVSHDMINLQHALPFLHGSLKTLSITLVQIDVPSENDAIARFLDTLWAMQNLSLESFEFEILVMPPQVLRSLASFLQSQSTIKLLDLPITRFDPESDNAQDRLYQSFPEGLQELLTTVRFEGPEDYLTRIRTIVTRAPQLRTLELYLTSGSSWWPSTFDNLTPFLTLSNLEELNLITLHGFHLDPGDIAMLGKSFPKMARFDLQPQPQRTSRFGIQATSLIDFFKAFPNLQALSIYIESINGPLQLPWRSTEHHSQAQPQYLPAFNSLTFELLDVGSSFLEDKDIPDMAELLSVLCQNPSLEIKYKGKETALQGRARPWRKVEALVKLVQGVKQDATKPYHEWCRALILEKVASSELPESVIVGGMVQST